MEGNVICKEWREVARVFEKSTSKPLPHLKNRLLNEWFEYRNDKLRVYYHIQTQWNHNMSSRGLHHMPVSSPSNKVAHCPAI
jgi:hypothetical protein